MFRMPPLRAVSVDIHNPTPFLPPILFSTLESASEWFREKRGSIRARGVSFVFRLLENVFIFDESLNGALQEEPRFDAKASAA